MKRICLKLMPSSQIGRALGGQGEAGRPPAPLPATPPRRTCPSSASSTAGGRRRRAWRGASRRPVDRREPSAPCAFRRSRRARRAAFEDVRLRTSSSSPAQSRKAAPSRSGAECSSRRSRYAMRSEKGGKTGLPWDLEETPICSLSSRSAARASSLGSRRPATRLRMHNLAAARREKKGEKEMAEQAAAGAERAPRLGQRGLTPRKLTGGSLARQTSLRHRLSGRPPDDPPKDKASSLMISGAAAGAVSKLLTAPVDRVKIMYQVSSSRQFSISAGMRTAADIIRTSGVAALWRGNSYA